MKAETPSRTAAFVAAARYLGRMLPREVQLVEDPYGAAFGGRWIHRLLERRAAHLALPLPFEEPWLVYMQVRTRVLDDAVRAFARDGGRQIVLLGAGYDCRALRLADSGAQFYEVDHPATQGHKQRVLARLGAISAARYLAWNFETRPIAELPGALAALGLDRRARVLTIWEGVTMYLTEPAIDASLRAIHAYGAAGSQLAMTYFARTRVEAPTLVQRAAKAVVARMGEPWRFGWDPGELAPYLAARGFSLAGDTSMAEAGRALLPASYVDAIKDPSRRIAIAAIRQGAEQVAFAART
jgi:methyltransferase (TIGR00027 family)